MTSLTMFLINMTFIRLKEKLGKGVTDKGSEETEEYISATKKNAGNYRLGRRKHKKQAVRERKRGGGRWIS